MKITERKLRSIIRNVIKESAQEELEIYDDLERGYDPYVQKIGNAYFQYLHLDHGKMSPEEWAEVYLNMNSYRDDETRKKVSDILKKAAKAADQIHYGY